MDHYVSHVNNQIELAHKAFLQSREVSPSTRASWLLSLASTLDKNRDELIGIADGETNLGEIRLANELERTIFQIRLFAEEVVNGLAFDATIDNADEMWPMGARPDIRRMNVPLGPVGVFGSSNFPFAFSVFGGDTISALAAGCTVVHKIHEAHENLGTRIAELGVDALSSAGAPKGLFGTVSGRVAGTSLVVHPLVQAVAFTGSTRVGQILMDLAVSRSVPIPFYGELGSINPVFVSKRAWGARKERILEEYLSSFTLGMGQFCTKPGLLFIPRLDSATKESLVEDVESITPFPMLSPQLRDSYRASRDAMAARSAVQMITEGSDGLAPKPTLFYTTLKEVNEDPSIIREEMFGPASIVIEYDGWSDLVDIATRFDGQLTATIHAEEGEDVSELVSAVQEVAGRLIWNQWPTGVTVSHAQQHGGPYPATTAPGTTSVGPNAIHRFTRPVAFQGFPSSQLPPALVDSNPWEIQRVLNGKRE